MTIVVSGATGFIGRVLVPTLTDLGHRVLGLSRASGDITTSHAFDGLLGEKVEHVFHLAGTSSIPASWSDVPGFVHTNVVGTTRVAQWCRDQGCALTLVSSYMYGRPAYLPIDEAHPVAASNPYALSKRLAEEVAMFYARECGVKCTIARPFGLYGPRQPETFLVPTIVRQVLSGEQIEVNDLHSSKRDYLFIDDFVEALVKTLAPSEALRIFNLGNGVSYTVAEVVALAQHVAGTNKPVVSLGRRRANEYPDLVADISKARQELGWVPRTSLEQGLTRCIEEANGH